MRRVTNPAAAAWRVGALSCGRRRKIERDEIERDKKRQRVTTCKGQELRGKHSTTYQMSGRD